jgi:putative thioredoxin
MNASNYIIDVTEADFPYEVLAYSERVPVIVDFWAEWCIPCRTLSPVLEKLAEEAKGAFRLAKLNVDQNQNLARQYRVTSIPSVKAFKSGQEVNEFSGLQPEPKIRQFLRSLAPSDTDLALEKGQSLLTLESWSGAEKAFRQVLEQSPVDAEAMLGLAKSLLAQGRVDEAVTQMASIPPSKAYTAAQMLQPLAKAMHRLQKQEQAWSEDAHEAAYQRALRLAMRGNLPAAMDGVLDVLREDKRFRSGEARLVMLGLLEIMGDANPLTRQYRQELASVLF